jgi:hypothetical protein
MLFLVVGCEFDLLQLSLDVGVFNFGSFDIG